MVALILAVVYGLAVDKAVPPEATLNQATVAPVGAVADKVNVPASHLVVEPPAPIVGVEGLALTVTTVPVLAGLEQPEAVVITV